MLLFFGMSGERTLSLRLRKDRVIVASAVAVLLVLLAVSVFFVLKIYSDRKDVESFIISFMAENRREFCDIFESKYYSFSDNATFSLICNGRPLLLDYYNNSVHYSMNGWEWLKNTQYWNELKDCDYFKKENNKLLFPCFVDNKTMNLLSFDFDGFKLFNKTEISMLDYAIPSFKKSYPYLNNCTLENYSYGNFSEKRPSDLTFNCQGSIYNLTTIFYFTYPPGIFDNLTESEKQIHCENIIGGMLLESNNIPDIGACHKNTSIGKLVYDYTSKFFPISVFPDGGITRLEIVNYLGQSMLSGFSQGSIFAVLENTPEYYFLSGNSSLIYNVYGIRQDMVLKWKEDGFYEPFYRQ